MEYKGIDNYKRDNPMFLHFIYLIWTIIIKYEAFTLTTLTKSLKFGEKNPQALYSFFTICSWKEDILSSFTHSFLQFPSKSNLCTKMLEDLASFVDVWQNNVTLKKSTEYVMAYTTSSKPTSLKLIIPSYKVHKKPVNIQHILARMGISCHL